MAKLVKVEVYVVFDVTSEPENRPAPEEQDINPSQVVSDEDGDSSGKGGHPIYCDVHLHDGRTLHVKGTKTEVNNLLGRSGD
jgi:hypothetical protein